MDDKELVRLRADVDSARAQLAALPARLAKARAAVADAKRQHGLAALAGRKTDAAAAAVATAESELRGLELAQAVAPEAVDVARKALAATCIAGLLEHLERLEKRCLELAQQYATDPAVQDDYSIALWQRCDVACALDGRVDRQMQSRVRAIKGVSVRALVFGESPDGWLKQTVDRNAGPPTFDRPWAPLEAELARMAREDEAARNAELRTALERGTVRPAC